MSTAFASTKRALDSKGRPFKLIAASDNVLTVFRLAFRYFLFVFGAGCVLGPIRIFALVPRIGVRSAELIEAPVMLCVIVFAARNMLRMSSARGFSHWLVVGWLAFLFMIAAEFALADVLTGQRIGRYMANRDPIAGPVYYAELVLFAFLPFLFAKRRNWPG